MNHRRRRINYVDGALWIALIITTGLSAILFWWIWFLKQTEANEEAAVVVSSPTEELAISVVLSPTITPSPTESPTSTLTPTRFADTSSPNLGNPTLTETPTATETIATPTETVTLTEPPLVTEVASNPTLTETVIPTEVTATPTQTSTEVAVINPTLTETAIPTEVVAILESTETATFTEITIDPTLTPTEVAATSTFTQTATEVVTEAVPSLTETAIPTEVAVNPTLTETPLPTEAVTIPVTTETPADVVDDGSPTASPTPTSTAYPNAIINPIVLADVYSGEPFSITGAALPGDTIILLDNGNPIFGVGTDEQGNWVISLTGLSSGDHLLEVYVIGPNGEQSPVIPIGFVVNNTPTFTATFTITPSTTAQAIAALIQTETPTPTATLPLPTAIPPSGSRTSTQQPSLTSTPAQELPEGTLRVSLTPSATLDQSLLPATAIPTDIALIVPSMSPTNTPTATLSGSPAPLTTEVANALVAAPVMDIPQNPYSPFAPVLISGRARPDTRIILWMEGKVIGVAIPDREGLWQFAWSEEAVSGIVEAVAIDSAGNASEPRRANFLINATVPRIENPVTGITVNPGTSVSFTGTAPALAPLAVRYDNQNVIFMTADENGIWAAGIIFNEPGSADIQVAIVEETGQIIANSNIVRVTVASSIAPATGGDFTFDSTYLNRAYAALLALLLTSGGIVMILVGRFLNQRNRARLAG